MTSADPAKTVAIIEGLEAERCRVLVARDIEALRRICSEHLVYTHTSTRRDGKASYIHRVETGFYRYLAFDRGEASVTVVGSTALVTGRLGSKVIVDGVTKTLDNAFLAVWVREKKAEAEAGAEAEDGVWRFVAYQPTPIPSSSDTVLR